MEYFFGALVTLLTVYVVNTLVTQAVKQEKKTVIRYSQSHIYKMVGHIFFGQSEKPKKDSQSSRYQEEIYLKIVVLDNKAYWIKDHAFFVADVIDGDVDKESAQQVDTMGMDDVELKKMLLIVETLREGSGNDYRDSEQP